MSELHYHTSAAAEKYSGFCHAVTDGNYLFLSGQTAADSKSPDARTGTIEEETKTCLTSLRNILGDFGLGMEDVLRVNIYMRSLADFDRMNRVYQNFFPEGKCPARTTIGAGELFEGSLIEIDCMARMR